MKFNDHVCHHARHPSELITSAKLAMKKLYKKEKQVFFEEKTPHSLKVSNFLTLYYLSLIHI